MDTEQIKNEVEKNLERLTTLKDEVKLKLHLATLDVKTEWDERLAPKVAEVEQMAKNITDTSKGKVNEVIKKMEEFLVRLGSSKSDGAIH